LCEKARCVGSRVLDLKQPPDIPTRDSGDILQLSALVIGHPLSKLNMRMGFELCAPKARSYTNMS